MDIDYVKGGKSMVHIFNFGLVAGWICIPFHLSEQQVTIVQAVTKIIERVQFLL